MISKPIKKISLALLASTIGLSAVPSQAAPPPEPLGFIFSTTMRTIDLAAATKTYKIAGMAVTTRYVDQDGSARLMPQIAMRPLPTSLAKGPVAVMPTLAAAQISAVSPER